MPILAYILGKSWVRKAATWPVPCEIPIWKLGQPALGYAGKAPNGKLDPFRFEDDVSPHEIEFSDDIVLLTADEAKKFIEPPSLKYLEVTPDHASVEPGKSLALVVKGRDQFGQEFPVGAVSWQSTGGQIDKAGVFHAGSNEGDFTVTAASGSAEATIRVFVCSQQEAQLGNKPVAATTISWSSELSPQKWMHYYTKVLAKLVNAEKLDVQVAVEVSPKGGITHQQIDEIEGALRDLGISAKVNSRQS